MKRSEVNRYIEHAKGFLAEHQFHLPPFAYWTAADWKQRGPEAQEIRSRRLGWDLTAFGSPDFHRVGLLLFTLRNGRLDDPDNRKLYAEKIMVVRQGQTTPWHFHHLKTEDIINRGGGLLVCKLSNAGAQGAFVDTPVTVSCDGVQRTIPAGAEVVLSPGQSITLVPQIYHTFRGRQGSGTVLVGEVSSVNDDSTDNHFYAPLPRYPAIQEDEAPVHLLCNEYP